MFGYVTVDLQNRLYKLCEKSSKDFWASKKGGKFGKGVKNTSADPYKAEREGKLGEAAFGYHFDLGEPDWKYRKGGDKGDFFIRSKSIDVKMTPLIQVINERGKRLKLRYDIYVIGEVLNDDRTNKTAIIRLKGYITRTNLKKLKKKPIKSKYGNWKNYLLTDYDLEPLEKLSKWLDKGRFKRVKVDNSTVEDYETFFGKV